MSSAMHIGVIGGGFMGLTLAHFLSEQGQRVTVLEQNATLGGLHAGVETDDGSILSRYPHFISPNDENMLALIHSLGLQKDLHSRPANTGFVHHGAIYPLKTIKDFLSFGPLNFVDRIRLGQTIIQARMKNNWETLDRIPAREWLIRTGGQQNFDKIWAPLLEAKFDYAYDDVPATFIWSWLNRMSATRSGPQFKASLAYLQHGPESVIQALADAIIARGNEIKTQTRVREIEVHEHGMDRVRTHTGIMNFDVVIAAIPSPQFSQLLLNADQHYLDLLERVQYLGLICPLLVLDRPLSDYWTLNLTDPSSPFSTITQHPHPDNPNLHLVYLPKYTAPENDWMGVPDDTIRDAWLVRLRQIYPSLRSEHIHDFMVSRSRYVDPVHLLNAARQIPALQTPYTGLYLSNASQVYPQLPTNEAVVAHARLVAQYIIAQGRPEHIAVPAA